MIFIDGSNFYYGLKAEAGKTELDLEKFGRTLCTDRRQLTRIYYYNAPLDQNQNPERYKSQQKWFDKVRNTPNTTLVLAKMKKRHNKDGKMEYYVKGDDIHIAVDMLKLAYNDAYDTAILVSGDGDFYPAIRAVKEKGKKVENAYFASNRSSLLGQECDRSVNIIQFIKDCF
jgi:uncharacterized LabA/DUF88 family protein